MTLEKNLAKIEAMGIVLNRLYEVPCRGGCENGTAITLTAYRKDGRWDTKEVCAPCPDCGGRGVEDIYGENLTEAEIDRTMEDKQCVDLHHL